MQSNAELRLESLQQSLAHVERQLQNPLPTPHVGCAVSYYPNGKIEEKNRQAAIATKHEGPAKLSLTIFPPNGMPVFKQGVHWVNHPSMIDKQFEPARVKQGLWDYVPGGKKTQTHINPHEEQLKAEREQILKEIRDIREREEARKLSERTPPIPAPLPDPLEAAGAPVGAED